MKLRLAYWSAYAKHTTGRRFSLGQWSQSAGLSYRYASTALYRSQLGLYGAGKLAEALSLELGRKVNWWELFDQTENPALDGIRRYNQRHEGEGE